MQIPFYQMLKERNHSPRGMFDFFQAACREVLGRFSAESFGQAFLKACGV